ncbi:MAG: hypothetical protein GY742_10435 [Hyphomicrobiales bacterium]|nr:hypothetical protein [Hyphomicrobiales bacterium]
MHDHFKGVLLYLETCLVAGLFGGALPGIAVYITVSQLPAGIIAMISSLTVLITYVFSYFLRIEAFQALRIASVFCGFVYVVVIVLPQSTLPDQEMTWWVILALIIPVAYSLENVYLALCRSALTDSVVLPNIVLWCITVMMTPVVHIITVIHIDQGENHTLPANVKNRSNAFVKKRHGPGFSKIQIVD